MEATAGCTVFVPAGAAHTYAASSDARYLMILTPRLRALIAELQSAPPGEHAEIMRRHDSEIWSSSADERGDAAGERVAEPRRVHGQEVIGQATSAVSTPSASSRPPTIRQAKHVVTKCTTSPEG